MRFCGGKVRPTLAGADGWIKHEANEYSSRFVHLLNDEDDKEFYFVESCCFNKHYDPEHVFVPVQHEDRTCFIYKANHKSGGKARKVVKVAKGDGEDKISPFGSALSADGILWLCCFSESLVMAIDLKTAPKLTVICEVRVPAPNDVCLSDDGKFAYAGCGSWLGSTPIAAGKGTVWRVQTQAPFKVSRVTRGCQGTMAGVAEARGRIFCAHLQRVSEYHFNSKKKRIWTGYCSKDEDPTYPDNYYLADNLTWWNDDERKVLLTPCYRSLPGKIGALLDRYAYLNSIGWGVARFMTLAKRLRKEGIQGVARVNNDGISPEVDLSFSKGDEFKHVHLSLMNTENGKTSNHVFKIDPAIHGGFDGHVTHAEHVGDGRVVCVNFLKKRLFIIDAKAVGLTPSTLQ